MDKIDFKKELKYLYSPSAKEPALVEVPEMKFLMVDGQGDPGTSAAFQAAMEMLYGLSYTLKFTMKKKGKDWTVPPLEGLWWMEGIDGFDMNRRDEWKWTLMVMQPEFITEAQVEQARKELAEKRGEPAVKARFGSLREGLCVQLMHVGPYSAEGPTIQRLHLFAQEQGYRLRGKHHEIYLGDPRRTAPEKLKTVLRHPVQK